MQCNPPTTDHYNFDLITTDTYEVLQNNLTDEDTTDLHHYLQQTGHPEPEFVHQAVDEQPEPPTQQQATTTTRYHTQPTPTTWLDHSLTNYSRAYNTTSPPPRTDDGRQWNKSYEHMTTTNSSSGRSTQAPPTWQPRWERKAMWSSPLTWPMDGTSQKDSTEETSTVSTTVPPRTLSGWHHHARSGAHYNTSPSAQQHRQKHYKPQETTRNIHTWNLQATYTDDRCSTTGIASLNNPSPQQLGTHQHSKTHQATIAKLTNVNMEPHYPTTKETNSSSGSQPLCGPVILGWPKPWGGSVMMHTSTFPLKAHHQKSVSDRQQREHTTQQCVQHGLTSSTTSCRITTTTRNRDSNWMMKMMTTPLTTLTTMRQNNHNMTNNYKPCHSTTNTYNQHSNQCQTRAFSLDCRNRASKQQKEQYNDSTATLGIPPTRSLSSCSHNAEQATAYCKQHMTTSVTYAQCSNHHHRSPRAPWDTVERCSMNASWLTRCGSTSPGIVPQQPEEFPSLQSSTPPPSSWQPESSQWRSPRTFWKRWSEDGSGTLGLQPSSRSMTTEPGAVSSSEAGALITVSTLRSLQAKHTPDLASWKDVTKFYDEPSSSSWHKATSLSPQTTSSRRWRMWFHRSTMPRTCKGSQPPNGHLAMSHDCQATSWMRISCPPISHQVMRWCTNSSSSNRLLQPSAKPTSMPDSDGPYCDSIRHNSTPTTLANKSSTGVMHLVVPDQKSDGRAQQPLPWLSRDAPALPATSTGSLTVPPWSEPQPSIYDLISTHQWTPPPTPLLPLPHEHNKPWTTFATAAPHSTLTSTKATNANALKSPQRMNRRTTHHQLLPSPWILHRHTTTGTSLMMDWCGLASTSCLVLLFSARLLMPPHQWWPFCHNVSQHFNDHRHTHIALHSAMSGPTPLMPAESYHTPGPATQPSLSVRTSNTNSHSTQLHSLQAPTQKHHLWQQHHQHHRQWTHRTHRQQKMEWEAKMIPRDSLLAPATESDTNMDPTPEPNRQPEVPSRSITSTSGTEPMQEPDPPAAPLPTPALAIPEHQQQLYQPPQPGETFNQLRARVDRQETLSLYQPHHGAVTYGPNREIFARENTHQHRRNTPYQRATAPTEADVDEQTHTTHEVNVLPQSNILPPGWKVEDGWIQLGETQDEWQIKNGWLIRRHYLPRTSKFHPAQIDAHCPIPLEYLGKDRVTKRPGHTTHDRWRGKQDNDNMEPWTGTTAFKINQTHRQVAREHFYTASEGHSTYTYNSTNNSHNAHQANTTNNSHKPMPKTKARKEQISEKHLSLEDRLAFIKAKQAELSSFFQNDVWEVDDATSSPPGRTLRAHFILKWGKHNDGTPRAKARLITQGFRDPDALSGALQTESPTLSHLARNYILVVATMFGWPTFSADISTAFLQGKKHEASRTLWISLSAEANRMLGLPTDGSKVLRLKKPMYGLCDAPRAWFTEARDRLLRLGAQHPLDACLYLVYDHNAPYDQWSQHQDSHGNNYTTPPLCAIFGLHVDDIIGCGDNNNATFQHFRQQLQSSFTFRTWEEDSPSFDYCGAEITRHSPYHYHLGHEKYLAKQKPISFEAKETEDRPVTEKERTGLRATIGALQWPAGQSSPHLQASISQLAGLVPSATTATLREANKALRFAKQHADVGLEFQHLGDKQDLTFLAHCDAAFASRHDNTSQGGYLVAITHKDVTTGKPGPYVLVDWRSWKLPRVARSSLSAEAQAASETADILMYDIIFWQLIWHPDLPINDTAACQLTHPPCLVTDAKGLYDLLTKPELQPSSGADKRTSIEVLVAQDKLKCAEAQTKCVSSELQYADGMTKTAAALLLAQRLRTHQTSIKPDEQFTAAKKKDAHARKRSAEQFALKKPNRAMQALVATAYLVMQADATDTQTEHLTYVDYGFLMLVTIFVILVGNLLNSFFMTTWSRMTRFLSMTSTSRGSRSGIHDSHQSVTATDSGTSPEPFECADCADLRFQLATMAEENAHLNQRLQQHGSAEYMNRVYHEPLNKFKRLYSEEREKVKRMTEQMKDMQEKFKTSVEDQKQKFTKCVNAHVTAGMQQATNKTLHFARAGEVWHSDPRCEADQTLWVSRDDPARFVPTWWYRMDRKAMKSEISLPPVFAHTLHPGPAPISFLFLTGVSFVPRNMEHVEHGRIHFTLSFGSIPK